MSVIKAHVEEKGYDTASLSDLQAVQKMLKEENKLVLAKVENASKARLEILPLKALRYNQFHFSQVEPKSPAPIFPNSIVVAGIVFEQGTYSLLDGYHRVKYLMHAGEEEGLFIILS